MLSVSSYLAYSLSKYYRVLIWTREPRSMYEVRDTHTWKQIAYDRPLDVSLTLPPPDGRRAWQAVEYLVCGVMLS